MSEETLKLDGDPQGVVTRFAPNPNGPLSIGHARGAVVNKYLTQRYGGKLLLRFDDTDPRTKRPLKEAYGWIQEDMEWLGCGPDEVIYASSNIETYYEYARKIIELGQAYVCRCEREAFKTKKNQGIACPCRGNSAEENMGLWEKMFAEFKEGEAVLRVKTDIQHQDPALRDWTAFRIIAGEHPLVGSKYRVWPMLDFESAIEDHIRGVTHILRGIDLMDSGLKQKYIYDYFGWTYPEVILWGRLKIEETGKFSTSKMAQDIASGVYSGWDHPALPTLRAMKRRGILPESIREFMLSLGLSDSAAAISLETLYSINRAKLDGSANRYFFLKDPVKLYVEGIPGKTIRLPLHPTFKERGVREQCMREGSCFYLSKNDSQVEKEEIIKLMGLPCVSVDSLQGSIVKGKYVPGNHKGAKKIQCLQDYIECEVLKPDGVDIGYCDPDCEKIGVGEIIQFERYGFAKMEGKNRGKLRFIYTHD
ncbi:MAG: glutamate--tRNA ligase [Candidatus Altiarchaeota archaeon]|nr:glutamate--tRNA ligase [Candidatus Altiarchaeota archaeon]